MNSSSSTPRRAQLVMTMSSVTEDIWFEIFLCPPVKDILASKYVCKSWLSIISSRGFVKTHFDRAISSGEDAETLLVHHELHDDDDLELDGTGPFSLSHLASCDTLQLLDFPYSEGDYFLQRIISCQILVSDCGIVCVSVDSQREFDDIYLWNPATKLSKLVPPILEPSLSNPPCATGFGFDHINFDCKVVKFVARTFSAGVYSSNRNAWRKIEPQPTDGLFNPYFHVCLHGFLFTVGRNGMMAFDLNKEVFICNIKLPVDPVHTCITQYNNSIAISMFQESENKVKLWTLDDETCLSGARVEVSWTMKLSCDVGEQFDHVLGLFNNVEFLLRDSECDWFFFNPNKEAPGDLRGPLQYCGIFKHTKSLFPIVGSNPVKWTASPWRQQIELDSDGETDVETNVEMDEESQDD